MLGLLLCHSWFGPDIWYHLTWGRSLLENWQFLPETHTLLAQPIYANMYWLFQVTVYGLFQLAGVWGVSLFFALLWLWIARLWVEQAQPWPPLALAAIVCAQLRFEPRPEVLSYLFLSLELALLTRVDFRQKLVAKQTIFLIVIQILWTNCHGYALLGVGLAALRALTLWREREAGRRALGLFGGVLLASFVSPFGWRTWQAIWVYAQVSQSLRDLNAELMSPPIWPLSWPFAVFWILWLVTAGTVALACWRRRDGFVVGTGLVALALGLQATRNIPLFLILASPVLRECVIVWRPRIWQVATSAVAVVLALWLVNGGYMRSTDSLGSFGVKLQPSAYPIAATQYLQQHHFHGRMFNDSYDGGYLEYHVPQAQIMGDSYFADGDKTLRYFKVIRDPAALREWDQQFHFDALLINIENLQEVVALLSDPAWQLTFADSHRLLFMPKHEGTLQMSFYSGEDLRQSAEAFGVINWAGLAMQGQMRDWMTKILSDLQPASDIPAPVLSYAFRLADRLHDGVLAKQAEALRPRVYFAQSRERDELEAAHQAILGIL